MQHAAIVRRMAHEMCEQIGEAVPGVADRMATTMATEGVDLIDGVPFGDRAERIATAMAKANTARRVRDLDGYRRALRDAAGYILGALVEIGEPIKLPPGYDEWTYRKRSPRFSDTEAYRTLMAEREQAGRTEEHCSVRLDGFPEVVCDKGSGHPGPCHPIATSVPIRSLIWEG